MKVLRFSIITVAMFAMVPRQASSADEMIQKFTPATNHYARRLIAEQFSLIDELNRIDPEVLALFYSKVRPEYIANRGEKFNSTDVVTDNLPARRFILAGTGSAPGLWFIWYEHGGIAYHHNLIVFAKNGHWEIVGSAQGIVKGSNDFEALRQAIKNGQLFSLADHPDF